MRPPSAEHLARRSRRCRSRVEAGRQRLGEADADVDRRELADPGQRAQQLDACAAAAPRLLQEAEVVGLQHLVEVEVLELGGHPRVDHLHHLVGGDAVGEHRGDEGAGAGADVDVEVVDGAVDREQVERAQGADLVDAAGEAAAAEHQGGLRRLFAACALCAAVWTRCRRPCPCLYMQYPSGERPERRSGAATLRRSRVGRDDETSRDPARGRLRGLLLLAVAAAEASHACDQMRAGCAREAARRSGLLVVDAETGEVVCASAAGTPRPLASNMKLFTTATALASSGPETGSRPRSSATARSTPTASSTAASTCRAAATRRSARPPSTTATWPGSAPTLRARAADPSRRDQRGHRPPLRRRHDLRPPPRRRRLRLRDQPLHRPALRPRLQLRLRRPTAAPAASPPTRRSWRPRSWPRSLRARRDRDAARRSPSADAGRRRTGRDRPLAAADRDRQHRPTSTPTTSSPRC